MTRMTIDQEYNREEVENAIASISKALILTDIINVRMKQAIERGSGLVDLLMPGLEHVQEVSDALIHARSVMGEIWKAKEKHGW